MKIKSLLLGSAAALAAVSGAQAADKVGTVMIPEPETVNYVRVCDAAGTGYFYIPGTETCLSIRGWVRYDAAFGDDFATGNPMGTWDKTSKFYLNVSSWRETSMGALTTVADVEFTAGNPYHATAYGAFFNHVYMDLAGLTIGYDRSLFTDYTSYGGPTIWGGNYGFGETGLIQYNFASGAFSGGISFEEYAGSVRIDDYMPHVVVAAGYDAGVINLRGAAGFDTTNNAWAGKVRADVDLTDAATAYVMALYTQATSGYGAAWANGGNTWSVLGGFSVKATDMATINADAQWFQGNTGFKSYWRAAANVDLNLEGLHVIPEIGYKSATATSNPAWGGLVRFQTNF